MKVWIAHKTPSGSGDYEAARVRKTLKGACELSGVTWVDNALAFPDITHFISPVDDIKLAEAKNNDSKIVTSVGYSEFDAYAAFFEIWEGDLVLKTKVLKQIEKSDLVLVPNSKVADKVKEYGIAKDVRVLSPAVNLSRFQIQDESERDVFPRYYSVLPNEKIVVSLFDYGNKKALDNLFAIAKKLPNAHFFHFGTKGRHLSLLGLRLLQSKAPKNLTLCPIVEDDLFRSAMINASCFLLLDGSRPNCSNLYEAFAAKDGVVYLEPQPWNPCLKNGENAIGCRTIEEAIGGISLFIEGKGESILNKGYEFAESCSMETLSKTLPSIYESLFK